MLTLLSILLAALLVAIAAAQAAYNRRYSEPYPSCSAPNRSSRRNRRCQNATPRGGYCRIHHDQRARDVATVWGATVVGVVIIVVSTQLPLPV